MAWLPATRRWNARAHLAWASAVFLFVAYLAFILLWTVTSGVGTWGTLGGLLLWAFELVAAVMACAYLWELCDALGTEHWRRRVVDTPAPSSDRFPFVSLHVPAHNEPPEMVIETLRSLLRIDYPAGPDAARPRTDDYSAPDSDRLTGPSACARAHPGQVCKTCPLGALPMGQVLQTCPGCER
jgi:hypothetical protein